MPTRVIIDTNVVVAGLRVRRAATGIRYSADVLARWRRGQLVGVMGPALLAEYHDVLRRPESEVAPESRAGLQAIIDDPARTEKHETEAPPYPRMSKDPGDDHLLALVRAASPDFLCTHDVEGLLDLHFYRNTLIVSPKVMHGIAAESELVEGALRRCGVCGAGGAEPERG